MLNNNNFTFEKIYFSFCFSSLRILWFLSARNKTFNFGICTDIRRTNNMAGTFSRMEVPSLKRITCAQIAIEMWNQVDEKVGSVEQYVFVRDVGNSWKAIQDQAIAEVQKLNIPETLQAEVKDCIFPVGDEIRQWVSYKRSLHAYQMSVRHKLRKLQWTADGTVHYKRTAKVLLRDNADDVGIEDQYALACIYCLEEDIRRLWNRMDTTQRMKFYVIDRGHDELVILWTYDIRGAVERQRDRINERPSYLNYTVCQYAFARAADTGNVAAAEHFFKKLTPTEKDEILIVKHAKNCAVVDYYAAFIENKIVITKLPNAIHRPYFPYLQYSKVLFYLLAQMTEEQRVEVFKTAAHSVLIRFLDWPMQDGFMATAERAMPFLSKGEYCDILRSINGKRRSRYMDFNYQQLFGRFWHLGSSSYRSFAISQWANDECPMEDTNALEFLFSVGDQENIKSILGDLSAPDREAIIFSPAFVRECWYMILTKRWHSLSELIQEYLPSRNGKIRLNEAMNEPLQLETANLPESVTLDNEMLDKFFDDLISSTNKRKSVDDDDNCSQKQF